MPAHDLEGSSTKNWTSIGVFGRPLAREITLLVTLQSLYGVCHTIHPQRNGTIEDSTTLRRHTEFMKAGNVENQLKKIREELAWVQTEQKEMECWIDVALRDLGRLPRS